MWDFLFHHSPLLYLTQSVWRDEAFSILLSMRSPLYFIPKLTFEPPLYYILLHFWMKLFGTSEIAARSLSLVGFVLASIVVIFWAEKLFKKHWLSWFLPVFFFFNPQLLYYAFEIRAYGWYMFFAVTSMFAYWEKRWMLYVLATTLGLYTHTYMIIVPAVQVIHYLLTHRKTLLAKAPRAFALTGLLVAPWITKVIIDLPRLKESWYFPADKQIVKSVLGNIFVGYEGTPADLWQFTTRLSLVFVALAACAMWQTKTRARNGFFFLMVFIPLVAIIGISFYKPLFVNRYVLPSTIAQVFLIVFAIECIKHKLLQKLAATVVLAFAIGFNFWYPSQHPKKDIRSTMYEINGLASAGDVILTDNPLIIFETMYYSRDSSRVFWYNPEASPFPWYIGDIAFSPSQVVRELPPYPARAFIIHRDTTFEIAYNAPMSKIIYVGTRKK